MNALAAHVTSLAERYANKPAFRAVAIAACGLAAIRYPDLAVLAASAQASDLYLVSRYEADAAKKVAEFVEEMDRQGFDLTMEEINGEPFAHVLALTMESVFRAKRGDRIRDSARMLCNYRGIVWSNNTDAYEELMRVLDDLRAYPKSSEGGSLVG